MALWEIEQKKVHLNRWLQNFQMNKIHTNENRTAPFCIGMMSIIHLGICRVILYLKGEGCMNSCILNFNCR